MKLWNPSFELLELFKTLLELPEELFSDIAQSGGLGAALDIIFAFVHLWLLHLYHVKHSFH